MAFLDEKGVERLWQHTVAKIESYSGGSSGDSTDIYIGAEAPTGEDLPKLWIDPSENRTPVYMEKLWENASPTSEFAAQTISLTLTGYDLIKVFFSYSDSDSAVMSVVELKNVTNQQCVGTVWDTAASYFARRYVKRTSSGLQFYAASAGSAGTTFSTNNYMCIPIAIYGIKGVK